MWTHGWDFYTPNQDIVFHCWSRAYRETFKCPPLERRKALRWVHGLFGSKFDMKLDEASKLNDDLAFSSEISYETFGFGKKRTLQEYQSFCGVDFSKMIIEAEQSLS